MRLRRAVRETDSPTAHATATATATATTSAVEGFSCSPNDEMKSYHVAVTMPSFLVKLVKTAMEREGMLDRTRKITMVDTMPGTHSIPVTLALEGSEEDVMARLERFLSQEVGPDHFKSVTVVANPPFAEITKAPRAIQRSLMSCTFDRWIQQLPQSLLDTLGVTVEQLQTACPDTYMIYRPMLLWSKKAFQSQLWERIHGQVPSETVRNLYQNVAEAFNVQYLAVNGGIPVVMMGQSWNHLRSPSQIQPLYGDFGSPVIKHPTKMDLDNALWVHTTQNGIQQCWAPLYTMFSQGNLSEKTRILGMPNIGDGTFGNEAATVVDLYAGIGYFAFSYAKAGAAKVICWELNPWSVEGLERGAMANGWRTIVHQLDIMTEAEMEMGSQDDKIVVFLEDNKQATERIKAIRATLPPIRHVNCGLLPTSAASWKDAVSILDPQQGGCIHVHENMARNGEDDRRAEILGLFGKYARGYRVTCEHLERVKSYAPGINHCVLDIVMEPINSHAMGTYL